MIASILDSTKKALGLDKDYDVFDDDIIMHINSVFSTLHQLGVGSVPNASSFMIESAEEEWTDFIGEQKNINAVKTYMYLRVRLLFDPPATSFAIEAMSKQVQEMEWRLNVQVEGERYPWPVIEHTI